VTIERDGTLTGTKRFVAVDPLTRTSGGGYAFLRYPFPDSDAFTNTPQVYEDLHLVRLLPEGSVVCDRTLELGHWKAPQSILQTRDEGFVALIVIGS
jgi:hypothetical protein